MQALTTPVVPIAGIPRQLTKETFPIEEFLGRVIHRGEELADIEREIYWLVSRDEDEDRAIQIDWQKKTVSLCPWHLMNQDKHEK